MKKYRLVLALALVVGLLAGVFTTPAVADPEPGVKIQIPIIGAVTSDFTLAETWIQVQQQDSTDTIGAVVFFWSGDYPWKCPTNADGPCGHLCLTPKDNEETWTIKDAQILDACPDGAKSAIIYFVSGTNDADGDDIVDYDEACNAASVTTYGGWLSWKNEWEEHPSVTTNNFTALGQGQAVVHRRMVDPDGIGVVSDYVGIAPSMEADSWMVDGVERSYYAPVSMDTYHGFNTVFHIQNSGQKCTSITVYYLNQETCLVDYTDDVGYLAPGETIDVVVPDLGPDWLGSARIEAQTALGIIVDQFGRGLLLTHRANGAWVGDTTVYADLLYRELSGWISGIQVQNLSPTQWTWVQVEFFDNIGAQIKFLGDWVCPNTGYTFYLPAIDFLPFDYLGGAVIKSRGSFWHGDYLRGEDIFAVVNLQNEIDIPGKGLSYNAHPLREKLDANVWDLPMVVRDHQGVTSEIVIRNNSNCTKLRANIEFYNQNGHVTTLPDLIIGPNMVTQYNLVDLGYLLNPGFNGAASVYFLVEENFCEETSWEYDRVMPSVIVRQVDTLVPGGSDDYSGYEGIPVGVQEWLCNNVVTGVVSDSVTGAFIEGATITLSYDDPAWERGAATNATGAYTFTNVPKDVALTLLVEKTGYDHGTETYAGFANCDNNTWTQDFALKPWATIQGRIWCDGLVSPNGYYDVGEDRPDVTVKLYNDGQTVKLDEQQSDADGLYNFTVGEDITTGFTWGMDCDVVAAGVLSNADDVDPGDVRLRNINVCP